jgi:hypothetical protein
VSDWCFVWGSIPLFSLLNIIIHGFCVMEIFSICGLYLPISNCPAFVPTFSVLLYCYFEVFDRLAGCAYQL